MRDRNADVAKPAARSVTIAAQLPWRRSGAGAAPCPLRRLGLPLLPALLLALTGGGVSRAAGEAAAPPPPLVLERTIPLAGVAGRIDHLAVDLHRRRLWVAELGNGTVDVVDLAAGKVLHRIAGLGGPQGIAYAPGADLVAVAGGDDGSVSLFGAEDFAPRGKVELGEDADNVRLDPASGRLVVGYGAGALATIELPGGAVAGRVGLAAHPEGFQLDPATSRAFVNLPDAQEIAVVDLAQGRQVATWRVPDLRANYPLARDVSGGALAVVFRRPARLVLLDARDGAVQASLPACDDADDLFFDEARRRIYVSCGDGSIAVAAREADGYRYVGLVETLPGARTSLFVPELDRLFVAARAGHAGPGGDAALLVFRPQP